MTRTMLRPAVQALQAAIFSIAALATAAGSAWGADSPGMVLFREAFSLTKQAKTEQDFTQIIEKCEQGLKEQVADPERKYANNLLSWTYNRRGEARASAGQEDAALADFEEAVRYDPSRWNAYHNRGVSYGLLGKYREAMEDFNRTLELKPDSAKAYHNRGELRFKQGELAEAIGDYSRALRIAPNDAATLNSRGFAYYTQGNFRAAQQDFSAALQFEPNNAETLVNRGMAYIDQGMFAQAAGDLQNAVRADPQSGRAFLAAAWLRATCPAAQHRNADVALKSAQRAIELDGDQSYRYLDVLAAAQANAGQFAEAQESIAKAMALASAEGISAEQTSELERRRQLYAEGRPYRETPRAAAPPRSAARRRGGN